MIWRPTSPFGPTGKPMRPEAPPALRVEGTATPQQLAFAQQAFAQFAAVSRLSMGVNPVRGGSLPDGTRYTITTAGPQTIMRIWPEGVDEDDDRRSGIVIALGDLDRQPIPGHETGGVATLYLLTPGVARGSRLATGKWRVRKLTAPDRGGKAVSANSSGKLYFTGIEGRQENGYPFSNGQYGSVNEYAYNVEDRDQLQMYKGGNEVCLSSNEDAPIPFVIDWDNGEKYAAQLVSRVESGITSVDLLVGPLADITPLLDVGPVVDTVAFPSGKVLQRFNITVSKDGRRARCVSSNGTVTCQVTFHITPTALSYEETNCIPQTIQQVYNYEAPDGDPSSNGNYVDPVDGVVKPRPGELGTGTTTTRLNPTHFFAFGERGQEFEGFVSGIKNFQSSEQRPTKTRLRIINESGNTELAEFLGDDNIGATIMLMQDDFFFSHPVYTGSGWQEVRDLGGGVVPVYYNRAQQFAAYLELVPEMVRSTWIYTNEGGKVKQGTGSTTTPEQRRMRVRHKGTVILELVLGEVESGAFIAYAASDPLTGALCVNLIQVQPNLEGARTRLRSWIFLVDDTGVKQLQAVIPNVPENTGAITNRMLYSL